MFFTRAEKSVLGDNKTALRNYWKTQASPSVSRKPCQAPRRRLLRSQVTIEPRKGHTWGAAGKHNKNKLVKNPRTFSSSTDGISRFSTCFTIAFRIIRRLGRLNQEQSDGEWPSLGSETYVIYDAIKHSGS
ncbi:unnamed protein product, partial [Nesidiocoris tenuis]